ncbi:MAG: type II toxin-antitoxin system PemK/MazF family toxin [Hydrogenophilales bacterium]|nr:type II toxin-antitoxin system PemK/MazF family toxin [Hydrogenophilales bacterium]
MRRGEVWIANLNPNKGAEAGKARPVVIVQEDRVSQTGLQTVLVIPLTTQYRPAFAPMRVRIAPRERLHKECYVMVEQLRVADRGRFGDGPLATLSAEEMAAVEKGLRAVMGML